MFDVLLLLCSYLPSVRQAGGGVRPGAPRHGRLRARHAGRGHRGEALHVQHLHQTGRRDLRRHLHARHLPEGHRGNDETLGLITINYLIGCFFLCVIWGSEYCVVC